MLQAEILLAAAGPTGAGVTVVGRRRAGDLFVPRGDGGEHPRLSAAVSKASGRRRSRWKRTTARRSRSLDAANALMRRTRSSARARREEGAARSRATSPWRTTRRRREYVVTRVLEARERGVLLQQPGGAVPQLAPFRRAGARARAAQHPLREVRRAQVPRGGARQGPARGAALGGQPEEPRRGVPRAAAPARRRAGDGGAGVHAVRGRRAFVAGAGDRRPLGAGCAACSYLGDGRRPGQGQVQRVREWYEPHLERMYDAAQVRAADLLQLERLSQSQFETREAFLTEMALDPPSATERPVGRAAPGRGLPDPLHRALGQGAGVGGGARAQRLRRQLPERVLHRPRRT